MSGHKRTTVTISQEEYRRLYDAERSNYFQSFELPEENLLPLVQNSQSNLYNSYQEMADRQAYYEQVLDTFQDQVKRVESISTQSMVDQQIDFYNQLISSSEQLWQDTNVVFQQHHQNFEQSVQNQHDELMSKINLLENQVSGFTLRSNHIQKAAENWIADAVNLIELHRGCLPT